MYDLVYANKEVADAILIKYPNAKITDASDYIHTERFELEIDNVTDDEFYPFAIREGFARCCFSFEILMQSSKFPESKTIKPKENNIKIEGWIQTSKAERMNDTG